jgi:hypothetical protein
MQENLQFLHHWFWYMATTLSCAATEFIRGGKIKLELLAGVTNKFEANLVSVTSGTLGYLFILVTGNLSR